MQNPFGVENPMIKSIASYTISTTNKLIFLNSTAALFFFETGFIEDDSLFDLLTGQAVNFLT